MHIRTGRGKERCPEDIGNKKLLEGKELKAVRYIIQIGQKYLRGDY